MFTSTRSIFVIRMILHMFNTKSFCFFNKWSTILRCQCFPSYTCVRVVSRKCHSSRPVRGEKNREGKKRESVRCCILIVPKCNKQRERASEISIFIIGAISSNGHFKLVCIKCEQSLGLLFPSSSLSLSLSHSWLFPQLIMSAMPALQVLKLIIAIIKRHPHHQP